MRNDHRNASPAALRLLWGILGIAWLGMSSVSAREVRAIFIQPPAKAPKTAVLYTGGKLLDIQLPSRNFSPEVTIPNGELSLAILPAALSEGEVPPAGVPVVRIPEDWSRCLLLFFPDPKNAAFPARVMPVDGSLTKFPKGNTLIYNVSSSALIGKFGDKTVGVKPGATTLLKPPRTGFGSYPVAIDCILKGGSERTAICRTNWQHDPEARQILFVTPPGPGHKVPRVWGVLDRESKDKKKAGS